MGHWVWSMRGAAVRACKRLADWLFDDIEVKHSPLSHAVAASTALIERMESDLEIERRRQTEMHAQLCEQVLRHEQGRAQHANH